MRQINQESGFNVKALSPAGARGIAQFMPDTAKQFGIDPYDPIQALDAGAKYMAQSLQRYKGDYRKALASYNAGVGNVDKYGIDVVLSDDFAKGETKAYVRTILGQIGGGNSVGEQELVSKYKSLKGDKNKLRDWLATLPEEDAGRLLDSPSLAANDKYLVLQNLPGDAKAAVESAMGVAGGANSGYRAARAAGNSGRLNTLGNIAQSRLGSYPSEALPKIAGAADNAADAVGGTFGRILSKAVPGVVKNNKGKIGLAAGLAGGGYAYNALTGDDGTAAELGGSATGTAGFQGVPEGDLPTDPTELANLIAQKYGLTLNQAKELLESASSIDEVVNFLEFLGGNDAGSRSEAALGENRRQFDVSTEEGRRQFDATYGLQAQRIGMDERTYAAQREQFAQSFAENQRQYNTTEGRLNTELGVQTELGRGNLQVAQGRLGLDRELGQGQLALGQQRLGLDTELGRGQLGVQQGQLGVNQGALKVSQNDQNLKESQYVADVLRKPSDFLARAFLSRGSVSPQATVTQADIINNLRAGIKQYASGGATTEGKFVTGDSKSGKPTGNEEMIINPTNAPILVLNNDQTQQVMGKIGSTSRYADGTDPYAGNWAEKLAAGQWGNPAPTPVTQALGGGASSGGFNQSETGPLSYNGFSTNDPALFHQALLAEAQRKQSMQPVLPPVDNTPQMTDTIAPYTPVSQEELIATGRGSLPPAASAALYGMNGKIPGARPVGQLTPGRLAKLTPNELLALNTQLGVEFNTDLETEKSLLNQRFGPVVNRARGRLAIG